MIVLIVCEVVFGLLFLYAHKKGMIAGKKDRLPMIVALQALCIAFSAISFLTDAEMITLLVYAITSEIGALIAFHDLKTKTIDPLLIIGLFIAGLIYSFNRSEPFYFSIAASAFVFLLLFAIYHFGKKQMGFGDVKLIAAYAFLWGFPAVFTVLFYSLILSLLAGGILILMKKGDRKTELPFAPFLLAGHIISFILNLGIG